MRLCEYIEAEPLVCVRWTGKKPEDAAGKANSIMLAWVDGSMRSLGEKDLVLESDKSRLLRFRLVTKTQFKNKAGELETEAAANRVAAEAERDQTQAGQRQREAEQSAVVGTLADSLTRIAQGDLTTAMTEHATHGGGQTGRSGQGGRSLFRRSDEHASQPTGRGAG